MKKYRVEVERGEPGQIAFGASLPELPGCFTVGNTLEELEANLFEAVQVYIDARRDLGLSVPEAPTGFLLQIEVGAGHKTS